MSGLLYRPIFGGAFGDGTYSLATRATIVNGLHAVEHFVIDPRAGVVLSSGNTKLEALASARHALRTLGIAVNDDRWQQRLLFADGQLPIPPQRTSAKVALISRRRRRVFERSGGRCFYCQTLLQMAGTWHVDHQLPRALDGDDRPVNLVAACAACNLRKRDKTALEFVATRAEAGEGGHRG